MNGNNRCCERHIKQSFIKNKLFLTLFSLFIIVLLSFIFAPFKPFVHHFVAYVNMVWIPLGLGFLIGGLIEVYVPRSYMSKLLAGHDLKTICTAAATGFIFSGCSHGCLAIAFELYRKGASVPAVISFLLASPWANASFTLLLLSFWGIKGTLMVLAALLIAVITGWVYLLLNKKNWVEKNPSSQELLEGFSIIEDLRKRWDGYRFNLRVLLFDDVRIIVQGSWQLAQMVLWWVLIGMALASLVSTLIPISFFQNWMGKNLRGMAVTLALATAMEICSEGSAPLAFEIYRQSNALGNAFLFLMAGVVTDYTEIGLLWSNIGKKTAIFLPLISVPLALIFALLFNLFL